MTKSIYEFSLIHTTSSECPKSAVLSVCFYFHGHHKIFCREAQADSQQGNTIDKDEFKLKTSYTSVITILCLGGITPIDWDMGCAIFEGTFLAEK